MNVQMSLDEVDRKLLARDYLRRASFLLEPTGYSQLVQDGQTSDARHLLVKALGIMDTLEACKPVKVAA